MTFFFGLTSGHKRSCHSIMERLIFAIFLVSKYCEDFKEKKS